ncbi:type IV pilus biogenesis protein PilM [Cytobacillus sp. FJAT-54145]|uniref:Type IV pilus biogenesis protein PilM n=1 Tax=Cytobacillus spartinae TaxID=3299023 RepID=A0ABW6KGV4_9BACI
MAFSLLPRKNRTVNLIINDHSIRYVEIKQHNSIIPYKWGERYLPFGLITNGKINDLETLSNILEECIEEWKIKKRQVRFLVPDSYVIIRKVQIPADIKDDEIKGYLYLELGSSIHLPFEEPVFDVVVLSTNKDKKEVLIFAAQEDKVMKYSNLLTDLNLDPVAAEISPLSLYRLFYKLDQAKSSDHLLAVQFDVNGVNISIFENHIPFFMHHLPVEYSDERWNLKLNQEGHYELKYAGEVNDLNYQFEDIYKEINRLMDFYRYTLHQGQKQVTKILVNGDHLLLPMIIKEMESRFFVPITSIDYEPLQVEHENPFPRSHYLALGLALKEV